MLRAHLDPRLSIRVIGMRTLRYDTPSPAGDDRPAHVRAASGLAFLGDRLVVIQDDASFLAVVTADHVSAISLPRGTDGHRRFETALGNKADKLDLESCIVVGSELWVFGSGSTPKRERICRVRDQVATIIDAPILYTRARTALGGVLNAEGVTRVDDELWLFHRGNTGGGDPGPAIVRFSFEPFRAWLDDNAPPPAVLGVVHCDLGAVGHTRLGFTDAVTAQGRVFYLAAAEASANAVDDGNALGSQLGVIDGDVMRAAPLASPDGEPIKAEGIAIDPQRPHRAFITVDPDNTEVATPLYEVELVGPW